MQQPLSPNPYLEQLKSFNVKYNLRSSPYSLRFPHGKKIVLILLAAIGLMIVSLFIFLKKSKLTESSDFLLKYTRGGGSRNYCDTLTFDANKVLIYTDSCSGKRSETILADPDVQKLDFFLTSFQSISWTSDNQTTGGSQPLISLKLSGRGKHDLLSDPQNFEQLTLLIEDLINQASLTAVSGFNLGVTPTSGPAFDWQIYTNSLYNFSFEYPSQLEPQEQLSPVAPAVFGVVAGPFTVFVYQTSLGLDQFIDTVICQSAQFCTLSQTANNTQLGGLPAKRFQHTESSVSTEVTLVKQNDYLYSVNLIVDKSFDKTFSTAEKFSFYNQLLGSFKLTKGVAAWKTYRNPTFNFEFKYPAEYRVNQTGNLTKIAKSRSTDQDFRKGEVITIFTREAKDFSLLQGNDSRELIYSRELTYNSFPSLIQVLVTTDEDQAAQSFVTTQIRSNVPPPKIPLIANLKTGVWHYLEPLSPAYLAYDREQVEKSLLEKLTVYNQIIKTFRFRPYTGDLKAKCIIRGGDWLDDFTECLNLSQTGCQELSGIYQDCASPCRHDPEAKNCIQQCVRVCTITI